jgi:hypothetical protein
VYPKVLLNAAMKALTLEYPLSSAASVTDLPSANSRIEPSRRAFRRHMPEAIVGSHDLGETIEELHQGFPTLSVAQIKRLIEFAHAQREQQLRR